jgi:L,D-transpeptidase ErfK/SrfK
MMDYINRQKGRVAWVSAVLLMISGLFSPNVLALEFPLPPPGNDVVGQLQTVSSEDGDTLVSIGQAYDIGAYEMWQANPQLSKDSLAPGTRVLIPSQFILPPIRKGLVVNLAELRLYYFPKNQNIVVTFPVGVGYQGWNTPRVSGSVVRKQADPVWRPTPAIRAESAAEGRILPREVPPGPENPLGQYALYLTVPSVLLHGTLRPETVGRRSSHGCIRLFDPDIEYLFNNVPVGTPIQMIYVQDKIGRLNGKLYLESEVPFPEFNDSSNLEQRIATAAQRRGHAVDWDKADNVASARLGVPEAID